MTNNARQRPGGKLHLLLLVAVAGALLPACQADILGFFTEPLYVYAPQFSGGQIQLTGNTNTLSMAVIQYNQPLASPALSAAIYAAPGVLGPNREPLVPLPSFVGGTNGPFQATLNFNDPSAYNPAFYSLYNEPKAAFDALMVLMQTGKTIYNIATAEYPNGLYTDDPLRYLDLDTFQFYGRTVNTVGTVITIMESNAVYTNKFFIEDQDENVFLLDPETGGVSNRLAPGTVLTLPRIFGSSTIRFGIRSYYPTDKDLVSTVYAGNPAANPDGQLHARVREVEDGIYEIRFEDRLNDQPDRPEDPSAPKDFNDFVVRIFGVGI